MGIARNGRAEVVVDASPAAVWRVVSDVTRTGDWSAECHRVRWLGDTTAAVPGTRFRGRNRNGLIRWSRTCELTSIAPPRELVWRTLPTPLYPDSTEWRITLEPAGDGTRIVQTYQVTTMPGWFEAIVSRTIPAHSDRTAALAADLARLGAVVDHAAEPRPRP
jgi:uncharacterized protein YndB with AHSA1/START domain